MTSTATAAVWNRTAAHQLANDTLDSAMEEWVRTMTDRLVVDGLARWEFDPQHADVIGLLVSGPDHRDEALVVVYTIDDDAELSQSFHALAEHY